MWEEIRTPEGKLLFRINRDEKLVEGKKGEWVVTASLKGKEVKVERKVPPKRKQISRHSLRQRSKSLMNKMNTDLCLPTRRQHLCSSFLLAFSIGQRWLREKGTDKKEPESSIETYVL